MAEENINARIKEGSQCLELNLIKNFILWWALSSKGQLSVLGLLTLKTSQNMVHRLSTVAGRLTGNTTPQLYLDDVYGVSTLSN